MSTFCVKAFCGLSPLNKVKPLTAQDRSSSFIQVELSSTKENEIELRQALIDMKDDLGSVAQTNDNRHLSDQKEAQARQR